MVVETSMLEERIQINSANLVKDLVNINRKAGQLPFAGNREDIREKLLRRLRMVEMKGVEMKGAR